MAAYAALASLLTMINRLQQHALPPVSLDEQVESLTENATFLQEFLEGYDSPGEGEAYPLESRIRDVACAVKAAIQSYITHVVLLFRFVDEKKESIIPLEQIDSGEKISSDEEIDGGEADSGELFDFRKMEIYVEEMDLGEEINCVNFYQDLQEVIEVMEIVKEQSVKVQNQSKINVQTQRMVGLDHVQKSSMVFFDDVITYEMMDRLTGGGCSRVILITGMGGIGKTIFAKHIYEHPLIKEHFDFRAWATISQQYNIKEILCEILCDVEKESKMEELSKISEVEVGLRLFHYLIGRRYLVIMDDMWSIEAWEKIQDFFPNDTNSRILVTTRLSNLASQLDNNYCLAMRFLDGVSSWKLFCNVVFGEKGCFPEMEEIGKKIVENCRGLPLSIVVTGGLLKKLEYTKECWESVMNKLSSLVNLENDKQCLKILKMSYDHLPAYLKPCFLFMGVTYGEDRIIHVSCLIKLWASEGLVKPTNGNDVEKIALQYFNELVARNLIIVHKLGFAGNVKDCKIHDLLRDFCLKEADKERFYDVIGKYSLQCKLDTPSIYLPQNMIHRLINSGSLLLIDSINFMNLLWNLVSLEFLYLKKSTSNFDIWKMPQLRHVKSLDRSICLPDPQSSTYNMIMENLQTLKGVTNFKCSEEVVKRIPNIKKLGIKYYHSRFRSYVVSDCYYLNNLEYLSKLESLHCAVHNASGDYLEKITFPHSLKKLTLHFRSDEISACFYAYVHLDGVLEKIGSLPLLQKLSVRGGCFGNEKWEIGEGQFPSLIHLSLEWCRNFHYWTLDCSSMPHLEQLYFSGLHELKEIPSEIGEISSLKTIRFSHATKSVMKSLNKIVEEQVKLCGKLHFDIEV